MCKYIKWELWDYYKKNSKLLIGILAIFLLFLIVPSNSSGFIEGLINFGFIIILIVSIFGAFLIGTKRVVNTFNKKTFLLESMISTSPKKLLLAKYIVGLLINLFYVLIGMLGILVISIKFSNLIDTIEAIREIFENIDLISIFQATSMLLSATLAWMSVIVMGFVIAKVLVPNGKGSGILGGVIIFLMIYITGYAWDSLLISEIIDKHPIIGTDLICLIITAIAYFITVTLIEKKLEIYN